MPHLPLLIRDLAFLLATAACATILCRFLRQPVVLGYLFAGFLVGPNFPWFPRITDAGSIQVWAEIGIIFLFFGLGLEFSWKRLMSVGLPATLSALMEIGFLMLLGYAFGMALGWTHISSLFLGGVLSISSTTIIAKTFEEMGLKTKKFSRLVIGVLIVEDVAAVLLLVLLSTIALTREVQGTQLAFTTIKLFFFLTLWFVVGIFLLPSLLRRLRSYFSQESLLLFSIALCLLLVLGAEAVGFSAALGAFLMGSVLAETEEGERIEHLVRPVRDLFGAVFFVSVGMLIDPVLIKDNALLILALSLVTILGKVAANFLGGVLAGQGIRTSFATGLSLAQIGEFSFLIAALGQSSKVTNSLLYPLTLGVAITTTFTTPYLIRFSDPLGKWLEEKIPLRFRQSQDHRKPSAKERMSLRSSLAKLGSRLLLNSVIALGFIFASDQWLRPLLEENLESRALAHFVSGLLTFLFAAPFIWGAAMGRVSHEHLGGRDRRLFLLALGFRFLVGVALLEIFLTAFLPASLALVGVVVVLLLVLYFSPSAITRLYAQLESQFVENLKNQEPPLAPWDAHIVELEVPPLSRVIGATLEELKIRERFGLTVAMIQRGRLKIPAPSRMDRLLPGDKIFVIGVDAQIETFRTNLALEHEHEHHPVISALHYRLFSFLVPLEATFVGKTIRHSGIREKTNGLVVGIERAGNRILNPDSSEVIQDGDLLWIAGDEKSLHHLHEDF